MSGAIKTCDMIRLNASQRNQEVRMMNYGFLQELLFQLEIYDSDILCRLLSLN